VVRGGASLPARNRPRYDAMTPELVDAATSTRTGEASGGSPSGGEEGRRERMSSARRRGQRRAP
jgi:hypothetical protein